MTIAVPPFVQYQEKLTPLRSLWKHPPPEGDRFATVSIRWGITTGTQRAVQVNLGDIDVLAFSQVVALNVDNSRCSVEVACIFPDSGFQLVVPPYTQGIYPVFTNALSFYVSAPGANVGNQTLVQVLNSLPPPVAVQNQRTYQARSAGGASLANGTLQIVPATISGTLRTLSLIFFTPAAAGTNIFTLRDGAGISLWAAHIISTTVDKAFEISPAELSLRFTDGVIAEITSSSIVGGSYNANLYIETL